MTSKTKVKLKPGDTIGILGGGQLGRMLALAAARLGLRCNVYSPDPDSPAFDVVQHATCAEYADVAALELFASEVDVVTYEFENVPSATALILAARRPVLPDPSVLEITQDRLAEKDFVRRLGIATADYADVPSLAALREAVKTLGLPAVLKTRRFGYDGKGQSIIRDAGDLEAIWSELGTSLAILEQFIPFEREISVVVARGADGSVECFDVTENEHRDHILKTSRAPARIPDAVAASAREIATKIANAFDYVGRARGGDVRRGGRGRTTAAGERDRTPGAQFRALDARRRIGVAVRAAYPRHRRLAAGAGPSPRRRDHDQPDRQRYRRFRPLADEARRDGASLRQRPRPRGAENGACDRGQIPVSSRKSRRFRGRRGVVSAVDNCCFV